MTKILIVGGGYAGFYVAWKLEKHLRRGEAEVTLVDPLPYMTYLPFLPEVAAGSIEPRHAVVATRRHLEKTRIVQAKVTAIDPEAKTATFTPSDGEPWIESYDQLVATAGSVTRTFPIPGVADEAIGMKSIQEAVNVRDRLVENFSRAANLADGPLKRRLLNVTVVGGGFAGIETIAELRDFANRLLRNYPTLSFEETSFDLVEAMGRIMPEVSLPTSEWVIADQAKRGVTTHLNAALQDATDGKIVLGDGSAWETELLIWTAGVMAHPSAKGFGLPMEPRGRIRANAKLQVVQEDGTVVEGAWTAGDVAAVPDLTGGLPDGTCVPNAQHAVRQAKRLAKNLVATLRGEAPVDYVHKNLGAVAGLGLGNGVFQSGKTSIRGFFAWIAHRGYHGLAMPSWERKWRVLGDWTGQFTLGRDIAPLQVGDPRALFQEFASRPKPAEPAAAATPAAPEKPARAPRKPAAAPTA